MLMTDVEKAFQLGQLILAHAFIVGILTELLRAVTVPDGQKPGKRFRLYSVLIGMFWGAAILGVVARDYFPPYIPGIIGGAILGLVIGAAASGGKDYLMSLIWKNADATAQKRAEYGVGIGSDEAQAAIVTAAQAAAQAAAPSVQVRVDPSPPTPTVDVSLSPAPANAPSGAPLPVPSPSADADDFIPGPRQPLGFLGAYNAPAPSAAPVPMMGTAPAPVPVPAPAPVPMMGTAPAPSAAPGAGLTPEAFNRSGIPFDS